MHHDETMHTHEHTHADGSTHTLEDHRTEVGMDLGLARLATMSDVT